MAVTIKSKEEIETLREGGRRLAGILQKVIEAAKPGVSAWKLDQLAEELILSSGGEPAFKGHRDKDTQKPYPHTLCISINDEVVHTIFNKSTILKEGDAVGLDIGMKWPASVKTWAGNGGLFTDHAITIGIGKISSEAGRLIRTTKEALEVGIAAVRPGAHVGDVSHAIQQHLENNKLGIVKNLAGHGVGYEVHEEPLIPNYGKPGTGPELKEGMVVALEPITTLGSPEVALQPDGWTFKTKDGSLAAHFEHTIVVTESGAEILTE